MQTVLTGLAALAILTLFGLPVLALVRDSLRVRLLPALPVLGVIFVVIVSAAINWALPMKVVAWVVLGVGVVVSLIGFALRRPDFRRYRYVARYLPLVAAVMLVGGVIAWLPSLLVGSPLVVQPSSNSDAIWYVASTRWILEHPLFTLPDIGQSPSTGTDGVLFGPPLEALRLSTRLGQESVLATVSVLSGVPLVAGFSAWIGTWAMLGASGAWLIGEAVRMTALARVGFGVLFAVSAPLLSQVLAQNASSVLAAALLPSAIGLTASAVGDKAARRAPLWLAAACVSAVIAVYSEYLPFLGIALVAVVLIASRSEVLQRSRRALLIVAISVALAPIPWFRAIGALFVTTSVAAVGDGGPQPSGLLALLGTFRRMIDETQGVAHLAALGLASAIAGVVVIGLVAGLRSLRTRGLVIGAGVGSIGLAAALAVAASPYVSMRAADMIAPLVSLAAGAGWIAALHGSARSRPAVRRAVTVVAVVAVLGTVGVNLGRGIYTATSRVWSDRTVTAEFAEAESWVAENGGRDGASVTAVVGTAWDQFWLAEALAEQPDVSWVNLRGDLGYRGDVNLTSFWDGEQDPLVLVGPGAFASGDVHVLQSNDRFELVSRTDGPGVIVVPDPRESDWEWIMQQGSIGSLGPADILVLTGTLSGEDYLLDLTGITPGDRVKISAESFSTTATAGADGRVAIPLDDLPSNTAIVVSVDVPTTFRLGGVELVS